MSALPFPAGNSPFGTLPGNFPFMLPSGNMPQPGLMSRIGGVLTGDSPYSPLLNVGLGLLASGGPSVTPKNNMQRIAEGLLMGGQRTQAQQSSLLANQYQRERLRQIADERERRTNARKAIPGLLEKLGPQTIASEEGETVVPGLLSPQQVTALESAAEMDPEGVAGLLAKGVTSQAFGEGRAAPSVIRTLEAAGIDPKSPEGQQLIRKSIAGQDISGALAQLQVLQTQLEIQRQQQKIEDARRKTQEAEAEGRSQRADIRSDIFRQLNFAEEAAGLLKDLDGTMLQPGFAGETRGTLAGALAYAQDTFGADSKETKALASKFERLNSIATGFGLGNFEAFSGALSDRETQIALGKDLSTRKTVEANRLALADRLEIALGQADAQGIEVQDRKKYEALIGELRAQPEERPAESGGPPRGAGERNSDPLGIR